MNTDEIDKLILRHWPIEAAARRIERAQKDDERMSRHWKWAACYWTSSDSHMEPLVCRRPTRKVAFKTARDIRMNPYMRVAVVRIVREWRPRRTRTTKRGRKAS